jgi:hypothetical protein
MLLLLQLQLQRRGLQAREVLVAVAVMSAMLLMPLLL